MVKCNKVLLVLVLVPPAITTIHCYSINATTITIYSNKFTSDLLLLVQYYMN